MARKKTVKTPEQREAERLAQRANDLGAVGIQSEAANLPNYAEVEVVRAGHRRGEQRVENNSAWRADPFITLRSGMVPGAYDAVRRLERNMMIRLGQGDRGPFLERIDGDSDKDGMDVMVAASGRVEWIRDRLSDHDWWLLHELIAPSSDYDGWTPKWEVAGEVRLGKPITGWRATVGYITGEITPHGQATAVRRACANLKNAWDRYDKLKQRKAA